MRTKIVAGNWKMNTTLPDGIKLVKEVIKQSGEAPADVQLIVCPPFTHLSEFAKIVKGSRVHIGAQNCATWASGAYTGEISAEMLQSIGIEYVILGHSERREHFNETSEMLLKKLEMSIKHGLKPIFCCGEKLAEREANFHFSVVTTQLEDTVCRLDPQHLDLVTIAYEPVWAIGTGKTATPEQAQEMHAHIRKTLAKNFGETRAYSTSILYGGSCKPGNAPSIFGKSDVDGGLIGGASLNANDFVDIAKAFKH